MAIQDLIERHVDAIGVAVARTCAHWHVWGADAEDLRSDLMVYLLSNDGRVLRRFEGRSALGTYLDRVTNRAASKWIGRRARRRRVEVLAGDTYAKVEDGRACLSTQSRGESLGDCRMHALRLAVAGLSAHERLLLACRSRGMTVRQTAKALGCSTKAAERRLCRVISRLRKFVGTVEDGRLR